MVWNCSRVNAWKETVLLNTVSRVSDFPCAERFHTKPFQTRMALPGGGFEAVAPTILLSPLSATKFLCTIGSFIMSMTVVLAFLPNTIDVAR